MPSPPLSDFPQRRLGRRSCGTAESPAGTPPHRQTTTALGTTFCSTGVPSSAASEILYICDIGEVADHGRRAGVLALQVPAMPDGPTGKAEPSLMGTSPMLKTDPISVHPVDCDRQPDSVIVYRRRLGKNYSTSTLPISRKAEEPRLHWIRPSFLNRVRTQPA